MIVFENLKFLQDFDLRIDGLNEQINDIKKKTSRTKADIDSNDELLKKKSALLKKIKLRLQNSESDLEEHNEKARLINFKMESAGTNPGAYKALENELEALQKKIEKAENEVLEDMDKVEILTEDIQKGTKVLDGRKKHLEILTAKYQNEITGLRKEIEQFKVQRDQLSLKVKADDLEIYEELRRRKKGQVVFEVNISSCPSCGMSLPVGFVNSISSHNGCQECASCGALLHWIGARDL